MLSRVRNLLHVSRRFGWGKGGEFLALWGLRRICGYRAATVYRLDLTRIPPASADDDIDWNYLDVPSPRGSEASEGSATQSTTRLFVGQCKGVQCYTSQVSTCGFTVPERVTVTFLTQLDAYVGDCETDAAHRGKGIYPAGLTELAKRLRQDGKDSLYLFVEQENFASIRSVLRAGFVAYAECSVWYLAGAHPRLRFLDDTATAASRWHIAPAAEPESNRRRRTAAPALKVSQARGPRTSTTG
jgi:hypothetical protein